MWSDRAGTAIRPSRRARHEDEEPPPRRTQAAKQYYQREGHLKVPRKQVETITIGGDGSENQEQDLQLKLGAWIANQRSRAATLTLERIEQLSNIGM
ncbi:helicase associated domain-containing protein [Streptomyces netropsis]|uniref:helicase associated domain-containing protein n=1 Tax=Streptomyces netropsis TaxID=55404 RepID=UPI003789E39F